MLKTGNTKLKGSYVMSFKSKIDSNYYFLLGTLIAFSALLIYLCFKSFSVNVLIFAALSNLFLFILVLPMYTSTRFILADDGVRIHIGWYSKMFVPYSDIIGFENAYDKAMGYSLSNDRVGIYTVNKVAGVPGVVTVTPLDKQGFMNELTRITGIEPTVHKQEEKPFRRLPKTKEERNRAVAKLYFMLKDPDRLNDSFLKPQTPEKIAGSPLKAEPSEGSASSEESASSE